MSKHLTKPGGKPGQRPPKVDPARSQKPDHASSLALARPPEDKKPIDSAAASPIVLASPAAASPDATAPANTPSIDFQTIAMAYGDYTRKSFEQTKSFVEKLSGVRSLDHAIEIQTEFAKQAYETFVSESQKIRELYSVLARQGFEAAVARVIPTAR